MHPKDDSRAEGPLRRVALGLAAYRRRQRDYLLLRDMPQSLLEDIGLTRDRVRRPRWRSII